MKKYLILFVLFLLAIGFAAKAEELKFPVKELGNCNSKAECKTYCDKKENMLSCVEFAEKNGLMSKEEASATKKILPDLINNKTPGGCKNELECKEFCSGKVENIEECISFAKKNDLIPENELKEAENVLKALKKGAQLPGGCKDKKSCESFCENPSNIESCLAFAEASDMMTPEQVAEAKKIMPLMKAGKMPGNCKTEKECNDFCSKEANAEVCVNFAIEAGLIDSKDAEIIKKVGTKGPGNCKGMKECEAYCLEEEHAEECLNFAAESGLLSKQELEDAKNGSYKLSQGLDKVPSDARALIESCLKKQLGESKYNKLMNGGTLADKNIASTIQGCFESTMKDYAQSMMPSNVPTGMTPPQGMPSLPQGIPEQYKNMIPSNIPQGMPQGIPEQYKNMMPPNIPQGMQP